MTSITVYHNLIVDTAGIRISESRSYCTIQYSELQQLQLLKIVVLGTCVIVQVQVLLGLVI